MLEKIGQVEEDQLRLHPEVALEVTLLAPGHALVVRGGVPMGNTPLPSDVTWAFVVRERPDDTSRLLVHKRYRSTRWWAPLLVGPVELISFVMSQKIVRGIKERSEAQIQPEVVATAIGQ